MRMRQKRVNNSSEENRGSSPDKPSLTLRKGGNFKRGRITEKQKLRDKIKKMLLDAGWTVDYRPRRNRDYHDAVYVSPTGRTHWSIVRAYEAFRGKSNDEDHESESADHDSSYKSMSDSLLNQLTRRTKKKIEREMQRKFLGDGDGECLNGHREDKKFHKRLKSSARGNGCIPKREKQMTGSNMQQKRKIRKDGRFTLLARGSGDGLNSENDDFVPFAGKRTILSWLIVSGTVQLSQNVSYMNRRRTKAMLEGRVTLEGIHCSCCGEIFSVSKFEIHAGSKLNQPFQNIYLESGVSLLECQINAWRQPKRLKNVCFHMVDVDSGDPNDDTCCLCGDGGDLLCCDGCPSTFHQSCLEIKMVPPGDWRCPDCACKYCGIACENPEDSSYPSCNLCGKKYHSSCVPENADLGNVEISSSGSCGNKCKELFKQLETCVGVKNELEDGFSWCLVHRFDTDPDIGHPQKVESNSKLAVASLLMDECFLPVIDRRSGINIIRNVVYNCGSNFNRVNFEGFYTIVLEKGDEMISAASLRFHGTKLGEMPFIGTRHAYRRQGMCHRLMNAIESLLKSVKVERLVIPAISDLRSTWTEVFGFKPISQSVKTELRSINMLVFPGLDLLEKQFHEEQQG